MDKKKPMDRKHIVVDRLTYNRLRNRGVKDETFDEIITKLLDEKEKTKVEVKSNNATSV